MENKKLKLLDNSVLNISDVIKSVCEKCGYNGKMLEFNKIKIHKCVNCGNEQTVL
jgi:uncharacterized protein (DUF983 family)